MNDPKTTPTKVTGAMKKWCRHLAAGRNIRRSERKPDGPYDTDRYNTLNRIMAQNLVAMGLMVWEPAETFQGIRQEKAVLTDAGWRAAGQEPPVKNEYPCGYMQQRGAA